MNDENGRITSNADGEPAMAMGPNPQYKAEATQPTVTVSKHAMRMAIRQAERAVDDNVRMLNEAASQRDSTAPSLGDLQRKVDVLTAEREFLTRHVQDLKNTSERT